MLQVEDYSRLICSTSPSAATPSHKDGGFRGGINLPALTRRRGFVDPRSASFLKPTIKPAPDADQSNQ
jgi:hypothetical protein